MADSCEYGNLKQEMIRDRLIVGIRNETLSECLQMESDLTLEKVKKLIRQSVYTFLHFVLANWLVIALS